MSCFPSSLPLTDPFGNVCAVWPKLYSYLANYPEGSRETSTMQYASNRHCSVCSLRPIERSALPGLVNFFFCPPAQRAALPTRALLPCPRVHLTALPACSAALPGCRAALPARTSHLAAARMSRPAAACESRPAAPRVAPCCSPRVVPHCCPRVAPCSSRVAFSCPTRRALLQPAHRAPLLPSAALPGRTLPAPRALPCLRQAPYPACASRQCPTLRALAPCPARASALPCQRAMHPALPAPCALPCQLATRPTLPAPSAMPSLALPCPRQHPACASALHCPRWRRSACCPALTCPVCSCCLHAPALPCAYRQLPLPPAHTPTVATTTAPTTAATTPTVPAIANVVATFHLASLILSATDCHGHYNRPTPGGGASRARWQQPYLPQQRREWAARWSATAGGTCESTPAGTAASKCGGFEGGQQQQQHPLETLCP
ncbi:unnamed protein product [Closterium sp. NIES-54]